MGIDSELDRRIVLSGFISSHYEYGMGESENGALTQMRFSCFVVPSDPDATEDEDGEKIIAQVKYSPRYENIAESLAIYAGRGEEAFSFILELVNAYSLRSETQLTIILETNESIQDLFDANKLGEGLIPINSWDMFIATESAA